MHHCVNRGAAWMAVIKFHSGKLRFAAQSMLEKDIIKIVKTVDFLVRLCIILFGVKKLSHQICGVNADTPDLGSVGDRAGSSPVTRTNMCKKVKLKSSHF